MKLLSLNNILKAKEKARNSNLLFRKINLENQNKLKGYYSSKKLFYHLQVDDKKLCLFQTFQHLKRYLYFFFLLFTTLNGVTAPGNTPSSSKSLSLLPKESLDDLILSVNSVRSIKLSS